MPHRCISWKPLGVVLLSSLLVACGGEASVEPIGGDDTDAGEYVVERTEADGIETVRTVSGSRWEGTPRLVEELAIGEEIGDEAYLLGSVGGAWATDDRIYVVDAQAPAVRVYDHQGAHLFDIGRPGQGPGEYVSPMGLAVRDSGEVLITDAQGARITEFDTDGNRIEDWALGSPMEALGMQLTADGQIFTRMVELPDNIGTGSISMRQGMRPLGEEGSEGEAVFPREIDYSPPTVDVGTGGSNMILSILPFTPSLQWNFAPGGEMISGVGNEYRFYIDTPDGRSMLVEKTWQPTPVDPDEKAFRADAAGAPMRRMNPEFTIPATDVPDTKPAYTRFTSDRSGRLWVTRQGPSVPDAACRESARGGGGGMSMTLMIGSDGGSDVRVGSGGGGNGEVVDDDQQCWANTYSFDVFEIATGEFLGNVPAPEAGFRRPLFANDGVVLAAVTDELGTIRLKKYRLALN